MMQENNKVCYGPIKVPSFHGAYSELSWHILAKFAFHANPGNYKPGQSGRLRRNETHVQLYLREIKLNN